MVSQEIPHDVNFAVLITCLALAVVAVAARAAARWVQGRRVALEDAFCWLALAAHISFIGLYLDILDTVYMFTDVAAGKIQPPATFIRDGGHMMRCLFAIQLLFWITLYSVKVSLLFLFKSLSDGLPKYESLWKIVLGFTILSFIGCFISELTSCQPLSNYFQVGKCVTKKDQNAQAASLYYSLAVDVLTDLFVMIIPIRLVWNLRISRTEKISVAFILCVGVVTMICAIVRASSLGVLASARQIPISWLAFWASIECLVAIVVNCLPAFGVFLRKKIIASRATGNSSSAPRVHDSSKSRQNSKMRSEGILLDDVAPVGNMGSRGTKRGDDESDSFGHY